MYSGEWWQIEEAGVKRVAVAVEAEVLSGSMGDTGKEAKRLRLRPSLRKKEEEETGLGESDIDDRLQRLLGKGAIWQSNEQCEGMVRVMQIGPGSVLIVVLPTGSSKSILFMVPAVIEHSGTSIMVMPFVALMDDLVA